jgi:hypothetical protein
MVRLARILTVTGIQALSNCSMFVDIFQQEGQNLCIELC